MKGKEYEERMEGLFPLSRMVAGGRVFGEEENVPPSTSLMITGIELLSYRPRVQGRIKGWKGVLTSGQPSKKETFAGTDVNIGSVELSMRGLSASAQKVSRGKD